MRNKPIEELARPLLASIEQWQNQYTSQPDCLSDNPCSNTCYVALDGRSGSGKSTLAAYLASTLPSLAVIEGDEFYAGGSKRRWSARQADENMQNCVDWKTQKSVLTELKSSGFASWKAFDWHSEHWNSDTVPFCKHESTCSIAAVVLLEGVYSARTELASLFDIRALLTIPRRIREKQLHAREINNTRTTMDTLWLNAENHYFDHQLDHQSLSLILS